MDKDEVRILNEVDTVDETEIEAKEMFNTQYSIPNAQLRQDADVLDTWFSSWLWPMEVFKGITEPGNEEAKYYYPGSVLVTGQDIIFFWVARMVMAGMEYEKPQKMPSPAVVAT